MQQTQTFPRPTDTYIRPVWVDGIILGDGGFGSDNVLILEEIAICKDWIQATVEPSKAINRRMYSYSLKHVVEAQAGRYVSNGSFIKAALDMGFRYRTDMLNASFNMKFNKNKHSRR